MASGMVTPTYGVLYQVGAVLTCLAGCHSALLLASAAVRLGMRKLIFLSALQFSVQSIFSLHFVAMSGMQIPLEWGFDLGLTLISLAMVAIFGTAAISLALWLRSNLEEALCLHVPGYHNRGPLALYWRILMFILPQVPFLKLLLAVVLLVLGAAGCHHVGMWSMHGLHEGQHVAVQLNYWSFLTTVGIGGFVCVVAVLTFLIIPERRAGFMAAIVLTLGIALFHYTSATFGMVYVIGEAGVSTKFVMDTEAIMIFVIAQGVLSPVIIVTISEMAIHQHAAAAHHLSIAQTIGQHIASMDLLAAKKFQEEILEPSCLEITLFQIVQLLEQYRPYLPDTLFAGQKSVEEQPEEVDLLPQRVPPVRNSLGPLPSTDFGQYDSLPEFSDNLSPRLTQNALRLSMATGPTPFLKSSHLMNSSTLMTSSACIATTPRARRAFQNLSLGLRASRLVVLRARLLGLDFGMSTRTMNHDAVEDLLQAFLVLATAEIHRRNGVVVRCASGLVTAMWHSLSPDAAMEVALAIHTQSKQPVVQVVQSGHFLSGNMAADHLRAFNLLGPSDWPGQMLLRLGNGERHVFITAQDWEAVHCKHRCLPFERVLIDGVPTTVYSVSGNTFQSSRQETEWMYELSNHLESSQKAEVDVCWQAYIAGQYDVVLKLLDDLKDEVPPWYPPHLRSLAQAALQQRARVPSKSLDLLGWPPQQPVVALVDTVTLHEL